MKILMTVSIYYGIKIQKKTNCEYLRIPNIGLASIKLKMNTLEFSTCSSFYKNYLKSTSMRCLMH